mmetsp:Transcript_9186/g.24070  ORF Transcript_9186/g.24070 Transcript_9186/m.24070 type:complete len:222 (+) Transcript_9186:1065-1730(+)
MPSAEWTAKLFHPSRASTSSRRQYCRAIPWALFAALTAKPPRPLPARSSHWQLNNQTTTWAPPLALTGPWLTLRLGFGAMAPLSMSMGHWLHRKTNVAIARPRNPDSSFAMTWVCDVTSATGPPGLTNAESLHSCLCCKASSCARVFPAARPTTSAAMLRAQSRPPDLLPRGRRATQTRRCGRRRRGGPRCSASAKASGDHHHRACFQSRHNLLQYCRSPA